MSHIITVLSNDELDFVAGGCIGIAIPFAAMEATSTLNAAFVGPSFAGPTLLSDATLINVQTNNYDRVGENNIILNSYGGSIAAV